MAKKIKKKISKDKELKEMEKLKVLKSPIDWNNESLMKLGYYLKFSESRLSDKQAMEYISKETLKKLEHQKYISMIDNADKGTFKATEKFQKKFNHESGHSSNWGGSGGGRHASMMYQLGKLLPEEVVTNGQFLTSTYVEKELGRITRRVGFRKNYEKMVEEKKQAISEMKSKHKEIEKGLKGQDEINMKTKNELELKHLTKDLTLFTEMGYKGFKASDGKVSLTYPQLEVFYNNYEKSYREDKRDHKDLGRLMEKSLGHLKSLLDSPKQEMYDVYIEVITKSYTAEDIARSENLEAVAGINNVYFGSLRQ